MYTLTYKAKHYSLTVTELLFPSKNMDLLISRTLWKEERSVPPQTRAIPFVGNEYQSPKPSITTDNIKHVHKKCERWT